MLIKIKKHPLAYRGRYYCIGDIADIDEKTAMWLVNKNGSEIIEDPIEDLDVDADDDFFYDDTETDEIDN